MQVIPEDVLAGKLFKGLDRPQLYRSGDCPIGRSALKLCPDGRQTPPLQVGVARFENEVWSNPFFYLL